METGRYFWHGFVHKGKTFKYLQYSRPYIYHLLLNIWKASYTISAAIFVDVPYWPLYSTDKFISCVVPGPAQWVFDFDEGIVVAWTHIGWVRGCSRISHCKRRKMSVTAAVVWLLALSWRMMEFCTTKCLRLLLSTGRRWCCRNLQ